MQVGVYFSTENYRIRVRDCDDSNAEVQVLNSCDSCAPEIPEDKKCPCFGVTSDVDTSNLFDSSKIEEILGNLGLGNLSTGFIDFFAETKLLDTKELSKTAESVIGGKQLLGKGLGLLDIAISAKNYIEEPTTQNLFRLGFDVAVSNPASAATLGLGVTLIELYEFDDGSTVIDKFLKIIARELEDFIDCDLGAGVHGIIF